MSRFVSDADEEVRRKVVTQLNESSRAQDVETEVHAFTRATFRTVLGRFATGVTVVTAMLEGMPYGITANAFSSLSLNPPLILVCVNRGSRFLRALARSQAFAVNILSDDQLHLARYFADVSRVHGSHDGLAYSVSPLGSPVLDGTNAALDCSQFQTHDGGDHVICVGKVEGLSLNERGRPLLFHGGRFGEVGRMWSAPKDDDPLAWPWI
jgi:3-hydroxy-9,10-secoandrosta-1,3,5(10)-triene-9,17-dione monooxygenase reductase component